MAKRLPSQPPVLPGFTFIRPLGTGGFSDVFLYEQDFPRREVAVKVMLTEGTETDVLQMFANEADALARLSGHPAVLSVYEASRAADGRPYLVMEYCPDSYATVFREYVLSVPEVLHVGVTIAGALETVHRAGLLHRDVKPSNILRTTTGAPVLSDFGVASTRFFTVSEDRVAMSIPWGAPEIVSEDAVGSVAADIWSLGATVYSLLAGKSPFEREGDGSNTSEKLIRRIRKANYVPTQRDDVSPSLEQILEQSLSLESSARQASARVFAEQLQEVQRELGHSVTPLEILGDDSVAASVHSIARSSATPSRIPRAITVGHEPRARNGRKAAQHSARSTEGIPHAHPRQRGVSKLSARVALALALSGGIALVVAVIIIASGR